MATGSQTMTSFYAKRIIGDSVSNGVVDGLLQVNVSNTKLVTRSHNNNSAYYIAYVDNTNAGIDIIEFQNINLKLTNTAGNTLTFSTSMIESSGQLSVNTTSTSAVVFGGNIHTNGVITIGNLQGFNLILDNHSIFAREWDSTNEEYIDSALSLGGDTSIDGYLNVVGDFYSGGDIYLAEAKSIFMNYTVPGEEEGEEGTPTDFPILVNNDDGTVSLNSLTGALHLGYLNTEEIHIYTSDSSTNTDWFVINEDGPYATTNLGVGGQDTDYIFYVNGASGFINGHLYLMGAVGNSSTANTTQIIFGTPTNEHITVSSNTGVLIVNPTSSTTTGQVLLAPGGNSAFTGGTLTVNTTAQSTYQLYVNGTSYFNDNITSVQTIWFGSNTSNGKAILGYNSTYPNYGIWYFDKSVDTMTLSASGNANDETTADFGINVHGSGTLTNRNNRIPHTGNTTGTVGGGEQPVYVNAGTISNTSYALKATVNNGDANYVAYYSGARAISSSKAATTMIMPAHYYHNLYNNNPTTGTTVYVHYYNSSTTSTNTFANLRVKSGSSYKVLAFGGDGESSWQGNITASGHFTGSITSSSWIAGQRDTNAAYNVADMNNTGSYWPWMRGTNTSSAKWFSFGVLNNSFYWIGSATSRTENGYDKGMRYGVDTGCLDGIAWLRVVNNTSNNTDDAMVYLEKKTTTDWALKINTGGNRYGIYIDSLDQDDAIRTNGYIRTRMLWANQGSNGERQVGVDSATSGTLYLWSNTTDKGLYSGSGYQTSYVIRITSGERRFYGNVTGNVTGNCSGSSGSCTGNAATATTATSLSGGLTTNDVTSHGNLKVTTAKGSYYGINFGGNASGMSIMSINASHQGLYNQTNGQWILYYNAASGSKSIVLGSSSVNVTGGISLNLNTKVTGTLTISSHCYFANGTTYYINSSGTGNLNALTVNATTASSSTATGALIVKGGIGAAGNIYGAKVYNAVWNDYAECRKAETIEPGYCVIETSSGIMTKSTKRLQPGCKLTSDTFGTCMGETDEAKTPIAVAGRVLAYPYRDIKEYELGAAVCSAPGGTIDIMTRDEIMRYPERIVGTVSEIPAYETWYGGTKENPTSISVNGRIWIYVR